MRNCPICSSSDKKIIKPIKFKLFDNHPIQKGYSLVQCQNCDFVYADLEISQSKLDWYYSEESKYEDTVISTGGGINEYDKNRLIDTAAYISDNIDEKSVRILDIGCANGGLLQEFKNIGFFNIEGLDPSASCVNYTKQNIQCPCTQDSIFADHKNLGKFDVITLTHVLEHVIDVAGLIDIVKNLLNPNGYVYIECPDADSYHKFVHSPFQEFNSEHINHFTQISLRNLMELNGFDSLYSDVKSFKISTSNPYYAAYGLFKYSNRPSSEIQKDEHLLSNILKYIDLSEKTMLEVEKNIVKLDKNVLLALFGTGQFCYKILGLDVIKNFKKIILFDNSMRNIGNTIDGILVVAGSEISDIYKQDPFNIVITSMISEAPIREMLLEKFGELSPNIIGFSNLG